MNLNRDLVSIQRVVMDPNQLTKAPLINALDKQILVDELIRRGIILSREKDIDAGDIHLKAGDVVYVPVTEADKMTQFERNGCWPKGRMLYLARYTFKTGGDNARAAREDSDELYPWRQHGNPKENGAATTNPRLRGLLDTDELIKTPVLPPDKVFFTADTHFFDRHILRFRPQFGDVDEMNEILVRNWNETVPPDGIVFHLGDVMAGSVDLVASFLPRLNGTILLVKGNHDDVTIYRNQQVKVRTRLILLGKERVIVLNHHKIFLNHYPFLCYAGQYNGVWQLFGHVHSGREVDGYDLPRLGNLLPFQYDVGVDNNDYCPISFSRLEEIMSNRDDLYFLKIRRALITDIDEIRQIAADALKVMTEHGNDREWDEDSFSAEILESTVTEETGYTITERNEVVGYFSLTPGVLPQGSEELGWEETGDTFQLLERLICYPGRHGILHLVTGHCLSRFSDVRLVTARKNVPMLKAAAKERYIWRGEYQAPDGTPMVGYQKILPRL